AASRRPDRKERWAWYSQPLEALAASQAVKVDGNRLRIYRPLGHWPLDQASVRRAIDASRLRMASALNGFHRNAAQPPCSARSRITSALFAVMMMIGASNPWCRSVR